MKRLLTMNRRKLLSSITLVTLVTICAIAGCSQSENTTTSATQDAKETLTMATSADYPPYEFRDTASGNDEIIGFDVEIANYIAKELGVKLEVRDVDFNGLIPALRFRASR